MAESKSDFTPQNPGFANRVQSSFAQQGLRTLKLCVISSERGNKISSAMPKLVIDNMV